MVPGFKVRIEVASPTLIMSWFYLSSCLVLFFGVQRIPSLSSVFEVRREHPALILGGVVEWVEEGSSGSRRCEWASRRLTVLLSRFYSGFSQVEVGGSWSGCAGSSGGSRCSMTMLC
eukprot:snap_masked-scaffold_8-processed-gene-10.39-mRNA-1 protein AED:1.00 eAED:1.00 QI:0/-1/0/0/-1/1/1/0/116